MGDERDDDEAAAMEATTTATARPTLTLDKASEKGFVSFFRGMPDKGERTLRLFERSDFYTVHGDDAHFVAQTVFKTSTVIKYLGGDGSGSSSSGSGGGVAGVCVSRMQTQSLLKDLLLNKQYRVEIWVPAEARNAGGSWRLHKKGSPGNLQAFEELLFHTTDLETAPVVMALKLGTNAAGEKVVGVGYADATARRLGVSELPQTDTFANVEALVLQVGAKECLLPDDATSYELRKLREILERCNVAITETKKALFTTKNTEQDLGRLLPDDRPVVARPELELKTAMASVAALVAYLELLSDERNFGQFRLASFDLSLYMKLDAAAAKALNLLPNPYEMGNKTMSLMGLLDKCRTAQGTRLLQQWLKQPLLDLTEITQRQDIVEAFVRSSELRQTLQDEHLKRIPDLSRLAKRFQRGTGNLQDVVRAYQVALRLPAVAGSFTSNSSDQHEPLLRTVFVEPLTKHAAALDKFQQMVETTIDLDQVENHEFVIKPSHDPALAELRTNLDRAEAELPALLQQASRDLGLEANKKVKLEANAQHGHCLKIGRTDAAKIRGHKQYVELSTTKAGVLFTSSKLRGVSDRIRDLTSQYNRAQAELVKEVIAVCATYSPVLETLNELLAYLDVLLSFADVSVHAPTPYVRPSVVPRGQGDLVLRKARHACLEMQDDVTFIANDVEMRRGQSEFQIITGANMGGKSTYIRQAGVVVLLAQVGCFVPCEEAQVPLCDAILARVGAGDSQLKGVSTFMAEMLETAAILKNASRDSFIIIDELGRGTSTYDGFGLAWAISEYIATRIGCLCLFATHFHELTALSDKVPTVKNLHVTTHVADGTITLLYKVQPGVCDQSFGIHVAQLAHFPERVVQLAKRKALELEDFASSSTTTTTKHAKTELDEADRQIREFLERVRALPLSTLSDDDALAAVRNVRDQWMNAGVNSFVQEMLVNL